MNTVTLTYKRPPDRSITFNKNYFISTMQVIVTAQRVKPSSPIVQNGETVLADNFAAVWFVFTGLWYDVGKVYNLENEWTGYYCDIMKPVKRSVDANGKLNRFEITDLFLDLWINPDGSYEIQDEDEFEEAVQKGAIDAELEKKAWDVMKTLIADVEAGHLEQRLQAVINKAQLPDFPEYVAKFLKIL